jgi:dephospho-CoA kinase
MILGITGTIGAGKGAVVDYLVKHKGFTHYSVREFLLEEIRQRGLPEDRTTLRLVANEMRQKYHPAHVVEALHTRAKDCKEHVIIESIRTVGEAEFLKALGAKIVAVDADRKMRFNRIVGRGSSTDNLTFEQFVHEEDREMASTEPWDMNIFGVMDMADYKIINEGTPKELYAQVDAMISEIGDDC